MDPLDIKAHDAWDAYYNVLEGRTMRAGQRGVTVHASKYYGTFRKIARMCHVRSLDVRDYVETALEVLDKNMLYIIPKDIATSGIMDRYLEMLKKRKGQTLLEQDWNQQEALVSRQMKSTRTDDVANVLCRDILAFEDWFRVLYEEPINEYIMQVYGQGAWNELQKNPALRKLVREKRSCNLRLLQDKFGYFGDPEDRV